MLFDLINHNPQENPDYICGYCGNGIQGLPVYWKAKESSKIDYAYCNAECSLADYENNKALQETMLYGIGITRNSLFISIKDVYK